MKLSAQEEYGLRCLLHLARQPEGASLTIPEISAAEGLSVPNVAKLMRLLRLGGLVQSVRGQSGGYMLSRPPSEMVLSEVLDHLGGQFFSNGFCERHSGRQRVCTHQTDCSLRVLWSAVQKALFEVLGRTTVRDLMCSEQNMQQFLAARPASPLAVMPSLQCPMAPAPPQEP